METLLETHENAMWAPILHYYQLDEFISQGAYGTVFKATCLKNKRTVAIKMIGNFRNHEYHCVQILREIQLMRALNGMQKNMSDGYIPNILDLHISKDDDD